MLELKCQENSRAIAQQMKTSGGGSSGVNYSTDEQDTGLKWIDDSPIYQKTIEVSNTAIGYSTNDSVHTQIAHGVSGIGKIVNLEIICPALNIVSSDILLSGTTGAVICYFHVDATNIDAVGGTNYFGADASRVWYFTIRYTKAIS